MRSIAHLLAVSALVSLTASVHGQDAKVDIQRKLESLYVVTKVSADKSDLVTPGSVLVLHKDGLVMCSTDAKAPMMDVYKNGSVTTSKFAWTVAEGLAGQNTNDVKQRTFVAGEKFWILSSSVKDDGVVLEFYSDPIQDIRYYAQLKFPFNKKAVPPADDFMRTISEVVTVDAGNEASQAPQQAPAAPDQSSLKPIPPPPPPSDASPTGPASDSGRPHLQHSPAPSDSQPEPKTISLGETKDQVVAVFGQPQKIVNLGTKEIDYYPDMKVTFVNNKVTDVQ